MFSSHYDVPGSYTDTCAFAPNFIYLRTIPYQVIYVNHSVGFFTQSSIRAVECLSKIENKKTEKSLLLKGIGQLSFDTQEILILLSVKTTAQLGKLHCHRHLQITF